MWRDPIVEEVRQAGEELAKRADYNLHTFLENLRKNEKKRKAKIVSRVRETTLRKQSLCFMPSYGGAHRRFFQSWNTDPRQIFPSPTTQ
jgi:hypothetical protein